MLAEPEWSRISDGRMWRLQRGRDFECPPKQFSQELDRIAADLGKVARAVVDRMAPDRYVWVQFADFVAEQGQTCVCGHTTLRRVHRHFARCDACGAQAMLVNGQGSVSQELDDFEDDDIDLDDESPRFGASKQKSEPPSVNVGEEARSSASGALSEYSEVCLSLASTTAGQRQYYGWARDNEGRAFLLLVTVPRVADTAPDDRDAILKLASNVRTLELEPLAGLIDQASLENRTWDVRIP